MPRRLPLDLLLQTPRGELTAQVRSLERYRMNFELAAPLRPGDAADFCIILPSERTNESSKEIHGTVRILRVLEAAPDAPTLFSGEVIKIRREDLPELDHWLALHNTPTGRRFSTSSDRPTGAETGVDSSLSSTSHQNDTTPLNPRDLPAASFLEKVASDSYGFGRDASAPMPRVAGREAIRAALRSGLQTRSGSHGGHGGRGPVHTAWLKHTRDRARRQARSWLQSDGPEPAADCLDDPAIHLDDTTDPVSVRVQWRQAMRFSEDYQRHLRQAGLFLPTKTALQQDAAVSLLLVLPSGAEISCQAVVVAPMPTGVGLSVQLSPQNLMLLQQES